jgi:hypothetical protein
MQLIKQVWSVYILFKAGLNWITAFKLFKFQNNRNSRRGKKKSIQTAIKNVKQIYI